MPENPGVSQHDDLAAGNISSLIAAEVFNLATERLARITEVVGRAKGREWS